MQLFKYQMINKFSSIKNSSHKQKKFKELRGEIYLITASDMVWQKWKTMFVKHKTGDFIDPDTCLLFNSASRFKAMKHLMREFFRSLQGLSEVEMGKAATHILHNNPTPKRYWVYPKIIFTKVKSFVLSCYTMKKWAENRKKMTTIVQELKKLVTEKKHFCR